MSWQCPGCERDNADRHERCVHCHTPKPKPQNRPNPLDICSRCGDTCKGVSAFLQDTPVAEDHGARLCAGCRVDALRRRAGVTPRDQRCPDPECTSTVGDHIDEAKKLAGADAWAARFATRRGR